MLVTPIRPDQLDWSDFTPEERAQLSQSFGAYCACRALSASTATTLPEEAVKPWRAAVKQLCSEKHARADQSDF